MIEPQFNVPFARNGMMTLETYQMLKSIYDAVIAGGNGASAYEVAVTNGFVGTEAEWLASLEGADSTVPGPKGDDGPKGDQGDQGDAGNDGIDGIPSGAVHYTASATVPTSWLLCDGSAVSRTTYANLFASIGTTYGAGDGSTTFALPDLRGEFIRGHDAGRGIDSGRTLGSLQSDDFAEHDHGNGTLLNSSTASRQLHGMRARSTYPASPYELNINDAESNEWEPTTSADGGSETRPRNVALTPIIKT